MNVEVEMVSDTSVRVSWDSLDIPEITGYIVYYRETESVSESEESRTVSSSVNSVLVEELSSGVEYQFQVVAIAEVEGAVSMGQRSVLNSKSIITLLNTGIISKCLW